MQLGALLRPTQVVALRHLEEIAANRVATDADVIHIHRAHKRAPTQSGSVRASLFVRIYKSQLLTPKCLTRRAKAVGVLLCTRGRWRHPSRAGRPLRLY